MKIVIYWTNDGLKIRDKICEFFKIPMTMTLNGETFCEIDENMIGKLKATEARNLIQIRNKEWKK